MPVRKTRYELVGERVHTQLLLPLDHTASGDPDVPALTRWCVGPNFL